MWPVVANQDYWGEKINLWLVFAYQAWRKHYPNSILGIGSIAENRIALWDVVAYQENIVLVRTRLP